MPGDVREAKRVFSQELTRPQQMALVQEIVETRAAELCRAYKNVVSLSFGHRRRRNRKTGVQQNVRKPCVRLIVKKKWQGEQDEQPDEKLPKYLFAYWTVKGRRRLCAVPTDVESAEEHAGVRPQSGNWGIEVRFVPRSGQPWKENGGIACVVKRKGHPRSLFAVSCRHVFALSKAWHHVDTSGSAVHVGHVGRDRTWVPFGRTTRVAGPLRESTMLSFDAQLAEVRNGVALRRALNGIRVVGYVKSTSNFPVSYSILTPRKNLRATFVEFSPNRIVHYGYGRLRAVRHALVVVSNAETIPGDSGSPVVLRTDRGWVLVGMHFAGDIKNGLAYMLPAWMLLSPATFGISGETWRLL